MSAPSRLSRGGLKLPCVFEQRKVSGHSEPLTVNGHVLQIPENVAREAVRDLDLAMGEYASPGDYIHSVGIFLAALEKEGFLHFRSSVPEALPEEN